MKKSLKATVSMFLALVMLLSVFPFATLAQATTPMTISVSNKRAVPGTTVKVDISLKNNPGISSIGIDVGYDSSLLTLDSIDFNPEIGGSTQTSKLTRNPATLLWIRSADNFFGDVVFATLSFVVKEDIEESTSTDIEITYNPDDIYNIEETNINCKVENGTIEIVPVMAGDINGDLTVNNKDVSRLMQYLAHWDVFVNEPTLNVNGDDSINNKDVSRLMQYLAHWDVEIYPKGHEQIEEKCAHELIEHEAKAASCKEEGNILYWSCSKCGKCFKDALGLIEVALADTVIAKTEHHVVVDKGVEPTPDTTGLTEGSHCDICGEIIVPQIVIPASDNYIVYNIAGEDEYLQKQSITNNNPLIYSTTSTTKLQNISCPGYNFLGWYDLPSGDAATNIKEIPAGSTGRIELFARWSPIEYTINFDSPDVPVDSIKYTVNKGTTLKNAKWYGYTFVGWSDDNGFLVSSIKPGTIGNKTFHANWTSNRNKATSYSSYGEPIIIEDDKSGQFMFVYDIGRIDNVPLSEIEYIGNSDGINIDREYTVTNTITNQSAENMANTVSNATTKSSSWTLSEEWEKVYQTGNETDETRGKTTVRTDSEGNTVGGNYFVSNSRGGSSYTSTNSGGSNSSSSKVTTDNSFGINTSYDKSTEKYASAKLGAKNETELSAGVSFPIKIFDVSLGAKNTTTLSAEAESGRRDTESFHVDTSASSYIGTVDENNSNSYFDITCNNESNWNTTSGYEKSYQQTRNTEVSNSISEQITQRTSYSVTDSTGGSNSTIESVGGTDTRSDEYSTSLVYSQGDATTKTQKISFKSNEAGYYRLVNAGTLHIFGVVGYDVATSSYYTYSYSILDDERHTYLDYSKENALFTDCENALVPFEVPFDINEYVMTLTNRSSDLEYSLEGKITSYDGTDTDTVIVPQYYAAKNGADGSSTAIKVTGFNSNTFKGNTEIKRIVLPCYVTEIPDNAFEGCTNLESVYAMGVKSIGKEAFKGCTSLESFSIDNMVTFLGENAFEGVETLNVQVANEDVFDAAINSGAKKITVNVSNMRGTLDNKTIVVGAEKDYFAFLGKGDSYTNLKIESNAKETYLSNINLVGNTNIPIKIDSPEVTLNRITVENCPSIALVLLNDNAKVHLYGTIALSSTSANVVLSKNVTFSKSNAEVAGLLNLNGDYLVCGELTNSKMVEFQSGEIKYIDTDTFNKMLTTSMITFDANGGTVTQNQKTVQFGEKYGELPVASRDYYTFDGWYTAPENGEKITENKISNSLVDITLYAHWIDNPVSDWVLETELPEGARVEDEKWTYDLRSTTTSSSDTLDGWTQYDSTWEWGPYGNWSSWSRTVYQKSDYRDVETRWIAPTYKTVYHYSRSISGASGWNSYNVVISSYAGYAGVDQSITLDYALTKYDDNWNGCGARYGQYYAYGYDCPYWFNQWTENVQTAAGYNEYRYRDRSKVYTYYFEKYDEKESETEIFASDSISDVRHWVKYIVK